MDIKILVDTAADLPKDIIEKYNFGLLSFMSVFGDTSYKTGVDITNEQFYDMLEKADNIPTTSQTPPGDMYDIFKKATDEHEAVIYFTISSKGSGQNHTAHMVREDILDENPNAKLYIVDTLGYSVYIAMTAITAAKMVAEGKDAEEIIEYCNSYVKTWHSRFIVDDMTYLEKGGRINKTTAFVGALLDIKPILTINDGLVESFDKIRGKKKMIDKLIACVEDDEEFNCDTPEIVVVHSDIEKANEAKAKLEEKYGEGVVVMVAEFGPIVGTHIGRGGLGIVYRLK